GSAPAGCADPPLAAAARSEYLRLLAELDARRPTGGNVTLRADPDPPIVYVGRFPVWLGRDGSSGLALRDACVSRRHARIDLHQGGLRLEDCGSRNGTRLRGVAIGAPPALRERGEIGLGADCVLAYQCASDGSGSPRLDLSVVRGRERGWRLVAQLGPTVLSPGLTLEFVAGAPLLRHAQTGLLLDGAPAAREVELLRGDRIALDGA